MKNSVMEKKEDDSINISQELPRSGSKKMMSFFIVLLLLLGGGYGAYSYFGKVTPVVTENTDQLSEKEVSDLVAQVSKLMVLPQNETPTVATVIDKEKLAGQAFFNNAQNGDKLLAYLQSRKAVLYRPSENRIIEVSSIVIDENAVPAGTVETPAGTTSEEGN